MEARAVAILAAVIALALYLAAPALVALLRRHPERKLIYKLSPLTFFSLLLWAALIAWGASGRRDDALISKYVAKLRNNNRLPLVVALLVAAGLASSALMLLR